MKPILVYLKETQVKRLYENKKQTGCSIASQIRLALNEYWRRIDASK